MIKRLISSAVLLVLLAGCAVTEPPELPPEPGSEAVAEVLPEPYLVAYNEFLGEHLLPIPTEEYVVTAPLVTDERIYIGGTRYWLTLAAFPQLVAVNQDNEAAIALINEHYYRLHTKHNEIANASKEEMQGFLAENSGDVKCEYYLLQYYISPGGTYADDSVYLNFINVFCCQDAYMGGAHGFSSQSCDVFSLKTGRLISLSDLFTVDEDAYIKRICNEIYSALESDDHWMVTNVADADEKVFSACENQITDGSFALTAKGLTILIDTYTLGAYGDGSLFITIPYECIDDIMISIETIINNGG